MTVIAVLFAALLALWFATEGEEEPAAAPPIAPVATIAERVAALRDLEFEEIPRPVAVTPDEARAEALEEFDAAYPPKRRRADEDVLKMLGLIEPEQNLRDLAASLYGSGVAGYYNTKDGRLRTVSGAATGTRVLAEMVLAHELTHALEDQVYDLDVGEEPTTDDVSLARLALVEGSASNLMYGYVDEHFTAEEAVGGILGSAFQDTTGLPPFMQAQVLFPYVAGEEFVRELLRRGDGELGAGRHRVPGARARLDRADPAPARVLRRRRAEAGARPAPGTCSATAGSSPRPAAGASCRRASCCTGRVPAALARPRPAGAATATSCGARARRRATSARRRARTPASSSCAGAGTARVTRTSSRPSCGSSWASWTTARR